MRTHTWLAASWVVGLAACASHAPKPAAPKLAPKQAITTEMPSGATSQGGGGSIRTETTALAYAAALYESKPAPTCEVHTKKASVDVLAVTLKGGKRFPVTLKAGEATAQVPLGSEDGVPVEVLSPLRFKALASGEAWGLAKAPSASGSKGALTLGPSAARARDVRPIGAKRVRATVAFEAYEEENKRADYGHLEGVSLACSDLALTRAELPPAQFQLADSKMYWSPKEDHLAPFYATRSSNAPLGLLGGPVTLAEVGSTSARLELELGYDDGTRLRGWVQRADVADDGGLGHGWGIGLCGPVCNGDDGEQLLPED